MAPPEGAALVPPPPDVLTNEQLKDMIATNLRECRALRLENKGETVSRYRDPPTRVALDPEPTLGDKLHSFHASLRQGKFHLALDHEAKFDPSGKPGAGSKDAYVHDLVDRQRRVGDRYIGVKSVVDTRRPQALAVIPRAPRPGRRGRTPNVDRYPQQYFKPTPMVVKISAACPMGKVLALPRLKSAATTTQSLSPMQPRPPPSPLRIVGSPDPDGSGQSSPAGTLPRRRTRGSVESVVAGRRRSYARQSSLASAAQDVDDDCAEPPCLTPSRKRTLSVQFRGDDDTTSPLAVPAPPASPPSRRASCRSLVATSPSRRPPPHPPAATPPAPLPPPSERNSSRTTTDSADTANGRPTGVWRP